MKEPPNSFNAELWPHRRRTENNFQPRPSPDYQSREAEHPFKFFQRLEKKCLSKTHAKFDCSSSRTTLNIVPPLSSTSRIMRDGYFS